MRLLRFILLLSIACYALFYVSTYRLADGFSISKITSTLPYCPSWEVSSPSQESVRKILSQKFTYLRKGSQCYVFESSDGEYVLKFFRQNRYRLPAIAYHLTLPSFLSEIQNQRILEKNQKLNALFQSCKIAFEELKEDAGLVYLHLNKTSHLKQPILVYDKLKRPTFIESDHYAFLIQKKGELIYPYLTRLLKEGKEEEAKAALSDLGALLQRRLWQGIHDSDAEIDKNAGFLDGRAIYLDVGQFSKEDRLLDPIEETLKIALRLRPWLEVRSPELAEHLEAILTSPNVCRVHP